VYEALYFDYTTQVADDIYEYRKSVIRQMENFEIAANEVEDDRFI
jgi:hypothetical protein